MSRTTAGGSPLAGWRILVTRPADQSETLCRLIRELGGEPVLFPLLTIKSADDPAGALQVLEDLQQCDWLIFISANAVRYSCQLGNWWQSIPAHTRIAAIGSSTAEALRAAGLRVDLQPKAQFNSESLLEAPEVSRVQGDQVVIVRGRGGRETLAHTLSARGAVVRYAEVYRREPPEGGVEQLRDEWLGRGIDAVFLTSGEALRNLQCLLGEATADLLGHTAAVVMGERLAALVREAGCRKLAIAAEASDRALCEALVGLAH